MAEDPVSTKIVPARFGKKLPRGKPFKPGREKTGGRKRGSGNFVTNDMKEAIVAAMIQVGQDGHGSTASSATSADLRTVKLSAESA
jgi:hypothetical protein